MPLLKSSIFSIIFLGIFLVGCKAKEVTPVSTAPFSFYWTSIYLDQGMAMTIQKPVGSPSGCSATPTLPEGISLNASDCSISGTPINASVMSEYKISSSGGQSATIKIQVTPATPQISYPNSSYTLIAGSPVDIKAVRIGASITSCKISPLLPAGLIFDTKNCNISGSSSTKLVSTKYAITAQNFTTGRIVNLTLAVVTKPLLTTGTTFPLLVEKNKPMTSVVFINNESAIDTCSISPALPSGLTIDPKTCSISGTPTLETALKTYTITASNIAGAGTYNLDLRAFAYSGLSSNQVALIINDNDPYSVTVGEYYRVKRNIPNDNIIHLNFPVKTELNRVEFAAIKTLIDQKINISTQAIAIAWLAPSRVECNSITSAISRGFMNGPCDAGGGLPTCGFATSNPYYNTTSKAPFSDYAFRPSMMLAATTSTLAMSMIDKGIASDKSAPTGTAQIMKTSDGTRSLRADIFPAGNLGTTISPSVNVVKTLADSISSTTNTLFYFQGIASVSNILTNTFPPGAVADHLTSYGGMLTDSSQMSILRFIEGGVTGSFGTVSEPCAYSEKFPDPSIMITQYTSGLSLIESYWKSISQTFQGVFIGEPLANPWQKIIPTINASCGSANNALTSSAPTAPALCSAGTNTSVTLNLPTNKWTWTCSGGGGGTNAACAAPNNPGLYGGRCAMKGADRMCVSTSGILTLTIASPYSVGTSIAPCDYRNNTTCSTYISSLMPNSSLCTISASGISCITQGVTSNYTW